jgi:signal transduction histidine kinase
MGLAGLGISMSNQQPPQQLTPEMLVPRLGDQLVRMGLLTDEQLKQALQYQKRLAAEDKPRLLGQAIVELGFIDRPTLDRAVTEQILHLRAALEDANRHLEVRVQQRTAELEAALRKLAEINQLKANFVANVSHELRTPLTHIRGYLELLQTEALGNLNDDQKKALDISLKSAGRLQSLIDDLILFSLASRGEMSLTLIPVDLNQVVAAVLARSGAKADNQQVELTTRMDPRLPPVLADIEKISWVFSQLLDNAIKFTQPGGKISLIIKLENEKMVSAAVQDTGIGIPPEKIAEIFEPFHQLDSSSTRRYGGTGLGLSLVQQILEAHGSLIKVDSEINKGTTITFPLLVAKDEEKT